MDRILALPEFSAEDIPEDVAEVLTRYLRTRQGEMRLYRHQAVALYVASIYHGLIADYAVGCHRKGQLVLMSDGSRKAVEDVQVGDILAGPSGPRRVLELLRGKGQMAEILPLKGKPWVVNLDHVLTLWQTPTSYRQGRLVDISVREYLSLPKSRQFDLKLVKPEVVKYQGGARLPIKPYHLGVLIGDGSLQTQIGLTTADPEIEEAVLELAQEFDLDIRESKQADNKATTWYFRAREYVWHKSNLLLHYIRDLGLNVRCDSKFVPDVYKFSSVESRLGFLAGLLDADGHLSNGGFDFISKSYKLAADVQEMCWSVGLRASLVECLKGAHANHVGVYYRVSISGDCSRIPCRLPRKQAAPRRQKKRATVTGFAVSVLDKEEEFFGFELDGDKRYLLDDYTITHNSGKTLLSRLLPVVIPCERPLLLVPAELGPKTQTEFEHLARHWRSKAIKIVHYEALSADRERDKTLWLFKPDLIIADEAHEISNIKSARTRKLAAYMEEFPTTKFCALSGTILKKSISDMEHLCKWALKEGSPLPIRNDALHLWKSALDGPRVIPHFLRLARLDRLRADSDGDDYNVWPKRAVGRRIRATGGVEFEPFGFRGAPLIMQKVRIAPGPKAQAAIEEMRRTMELPNGDAFSSDIDMWRHAGEMACGYYQVWSPQAPQEWLDKRKEWHKFVKGVVDSRHNKLDSPMAVSIALDKGKLVSEYGSRALAAWREIRDSFTPNPVPKWIDEESRILKYAVEFLRDPQALVWTAHVPVAKRLSEMSGVPFFGAGQGKNGAALIDFHRGSAILTIGANTQGKNLQAWCRNLVLDPLSSASDWEQLLGRTHRTGQRAAEVRCEILLSIDEHEEALRKADESAQEVLLYKDQKLKWISATWLEEKRATP